MKKVFNEFYVLLLEKLDQNELVCTPGVEKYFRSKDENIPVPKIFIPYFALFTLHIMEEH